MIDTTIKTTYFSHGTQQGTSKISSFFESYIVLGFLGLILDFLGLSLDLFGVIVVSLGAILATLWPSLGSLRLLGIRMESLLSCIFFGVVESFMAEDCDCGNVKWVL